VLIWLREEEEQEEDLLFVCLFVFHRLGSKDETPKRTLSKIFDYLWCVLPQQVESSLRSFIFSNFRAISIGRRVDPRQKILGCIETQTLFLCDPLLASLKKPSRPINTVRKNKAKRNNSNHQKEKNNKFGN